MIQTAKTIIKRVLRVKPSAQDTFLNLDYIRHDSARLEHLASLGINLTGLTVLELGAGIGSHTGFFLDRKCKVLSTDARTENLEILRSRYPDIQVRHLDMDRPDESFTDEFDVVYCYGLLYHLENPLKAIEFMAQRCKGVLLLDTKVSFGDDESINPINEPAYILSQSFWGGGCRPTRPWVYRQLKRNFEYVYMPSTQPDHEEFSLDWSPPPAGDTQSRSIFIASRHPIEGDLLIAGIPLLQSRHCGQS